MLRHIKAVIPFVVLLSSLHVDAREISGLNIAEQGELAGHQLLLNGAGIRSKFIFDIYIGALYLPVKTGEAKQAIAMPGPKRVLMHILYDEVDKERLTGGWTAGFENNLSAGEFETFTPRLQAFNKLFVDVKKGDQILLDYLPGSGTRVTINNHLQGTVPGEDFNHALLKVWLGDDPADSDLKAALLGKS